MRPVTVKHLSVSVSGWPAEADGLRIAHISDLHLRTWNRTLAATQRLLIALEYDLLAVTGDFCDCPADAPRVRELARRLFACVQAPLGCFAVLGNHDDPNLADDREINLHFLRDETVPVQYEGTTVAIAGVEQTEAAPGDLETALATVPSHRPVVLLAHYPSTIFSVPAGRPILLLAGHTHGGQIRLPLLGAVFTNDRIPTRMARGLHAVNGAQLHVTPGIGCSQPLRLRYNCPPEISVLRVWSADSEARSESLSRQEVQKLAETANSAVPV